ncbi:hypothetical protein NW753_014236 [Fusarium oxysporum]|nr:hypothetical protein NW753_014236 [Fusarium oxysporum]KAJ4050153.1 hypothetical protein NW763_009487 [Fusarium oxysporum]
MASTPHASLKRTRSTASLNDAALDVLSSIAAKSRKIQSLSPNIRRLAAKLTHRARCATSHDLDNLKDSWEALSLLIESKYEAKGLRGRLNTQRAHINKVHFDLHIGDWAMDIHNRVKAGEVEFACEYAKDLQARLTASGMPGTAAVNVANDSKKFKAAQSLQISETLGHIQPEIDAVTKWHSEGETAEPPATPYLDRVAALCSRVGIKRKTYIDILHLGDSRNETAHHPGPRIEDYMDQNGNVDWSSVKRSCRNRKASFRRQFKKGKITQAQLETFRNIIDTWYSIQVSGHNPDGTVNLAEGMDDAIKEIRKKIAKKLIPVPIPDSPYEEGKWDDLLN